MPGILSIPKPTADRLIRCIALARNPGTPGEGAAVEAAIGRLIVSHAGAVIAALTAPPPPPPPPPERLSWRTAAVRILNHFDHLLTPWERSFLASLSGRYQTPTYKQAAVLERIAGKCGLELERF